MPHALQSEPKPEQKEQAMCAGGPMLSDMASASGYLYCWHFIQKTLQETAQSDRCATAKDLLRDPENRGQKRE